ncbi:MAG: hypothetical protein QME74_07875 [Candidatus Edwardsbacteria bacterium]|nr:hypothetical protein [Candidatus Edwardsbacteria bacterium]
MTRKHKKKDPLYNVTTPADILAGSDLFANPWLVSVLIVLLAVAVFNRGLLANAMIFGTDFTAGAYMSRSFLIDSLHRFGQLPLWFPRVYGGVPTVDPGAADMFYPSTMLLRLLMPAHQMTAWNYFLSVCLAGIGTFLFLRHFKLTGTASLIGAISYMFTGATVSLIFAGHDGKIMVAAWLPWMLLAVDQTIQTEKLLWALLAGLVIGCSLQTGHVQMSYYLLLAGLLMAVGRTSVILRRSFSAPRLLRYAGLGAVTVVLGFALYAVQALPIRSYMTHSPRGEDKGYQYATSYSMPPEEIVNIAWPEFSGLVDNGSDESPTRWYWGRRDLKLHTEYIGVFPLLLVLIGLAYSRRRKLKWFLAALGCCALVVAFGGFTPLYRLVYSLVPLMSKFRSPAMIFNTFSFAMAALVALGAQALIYGDCRKKLTLWLGAAAGGLLLFGVIFSAAKDGMTRLLESFAARGWGAQALWNGYPEMVKGYWIAFLLFAAAAAMVVLLARRKMPLAWWSLIVVALIFLELWRVDSRFIKLVAPPEQYFAKDEIVSVLEKDTTIHRVWPLQVHQSGNYLTLFGVQLAGGEHPNPLRRYNEFAGATPKRILPDFHNLIQHPQFLHLLGVKYLLTQGPIEHPDFVLHDSCYGGKVRIYRNTKALPRVWLAGNYEVIGRDEQILSRMQRPDFDPAQTVILEQSLPGFPPQPKLAGSAEVTRYAPNQVTVAVNAGTPSLLVMSDNHFPAWKAFVDGQPAECYRADYTFRAVAVPAGAHTVEFKFQSGVYNMGKAISLVSLFLTLFGIAGLSAVEIVKRRRGGTPA